MEIRMIRALDPLDRRPAPKRAMAVAILVIMVVTSACSGGAATPSATSVATPDSSASPAATAAPSSSTSPAPLPGGRLAYGRFGSSGVSVFTTNTDGSDEQALLSSNAEGPRWAPDGGPLSVTAESSQGLIFAGVVNADGSDYVRFDSPDPTLQLGCFAWSPDASRLACEGWDDTDPTRNGIYTVSASDGGDVTRVTTSPDGRHDVPGDYSPDGRQIVFIRSDLVDEEHHALMVINVDGSDEHALTDRKVGAPGSWSPDGRTILTDADGSLLLIPVDGSQPSPITIDEAADGFALRGAWSPDGDWIVFSLMVNGGYSDIYIMRKDGIDLRQITDTPGQDEEYGDWGVAAQ